MTVLVLNVFVSRLMVAGAILYGREIRVERTMSNGDGWGLGSVFASRYAGAAALLLYFAFCYLVAVEWYHAGYFSRYNLFFDADPNTNLASMAHGWWAGRNAPSHPLLEFLSVPSLVLAELLSWALPAVEKVRLREYVALAYAPLFACVSLVLFQGVLRRLQWLGDGAVLVLLVFALSFSTLLFAILPETYAISSTLLLSLMYYYLRCKERGSGSVLVWSLLGLALTGTTVTNVAVFFFAYFVFLVDVQGKDRWRAFFEAAALAVLLLVTAVALLLLAVHVSGTHIGSEGGAGWVAYYFSISPFALAKRLVHLVGAFYNTFNASFYLQDNGGVTFLRNANDYFALGFVSSCVLGATYLVRRHFSACWHSWLGGLLLAIMAFNVMLHLVFGTEMFLYSQHWAATWCLLLAPALVRYRSWGWAFLATNAVVNGLFILRVPQLVGGA